MATDALPAPFLIDEKTRTASATEAYDIVVVGGGTGGCFAAATAAAKGADVAVLERKPPEKVGAIACGDAIDNPGDVPGPVSGQRIVEEAIERYGAIHNYIGRGIWEDRERGHRFEVPFGEGVRGNVIHRHAYGQVIADECIQAGADFYANTVVQGVQFDDQWTVTGSQKGTPVKFEAPLLIDAGGALSWVQDRLATDGYFEESTFEQPDYEQTSVGYRELIRTEQPVPFASSEEGALLISPTPQLGYFWVFPFTPTVLNVGLGFQMSEEPLQPVQALRRELSQRPAFQNAKVLDKRGAAVSTRRPLDSAVASAYMAVGGAAATTSPTTGKGIEPAMQSGAIAGRHAAEAVANGDVSEAALFPYWTEVMQTFGAKYAAQDVWNIAGMAHGVDALRGIVATAPRNYLLQALTGEGDTASLRHKLSAVTTYLFRNVQYGVRRNDGVFNADQVDAFFAGLDLSQMGEFAGRMKRHYLDYPADPTAFDDWLEQRYVLDAELIERVGIEGKYRLPRRFRNR